MDKITALKLALDGKKVRNTNWAGKKNFVYFNGKNFRFVYANWKEEDIDTALDCSDGWEEYKSEPKFKVGDIVFVKGKFGKVVYIDADGEYSISFDKDDFPDITDIKESELEPA